MKQVLICKKCKSTLTQPVVIYLEKDGLRKNKKGRLRIPSPEGSNLSDITLRYDGGSPITETGRALLAEKLLYERETHPLHFNPQFYINLDDVSNSVLRNQYWIEGCCGAGVSKKPNRICKCGEAVGYELSECFTEHVFIPNNETTKWQSVKL